MSAYTLSVSMVLDLGPAQVYWLVRGETHYASTGIHAPWSEVFETRAEAAAFMYRIKENSND